MVGEPADDDALCEVCMGTSTGYWVGCDDVSICDGAVVRMQDSQS